jgi:hypothetical protein
VTVRGDLASMIGWQEIVTHHRRKIAGLRRACSITVAAVSATQGFTTIKN